MESIRARAWIASVLLADATMQGLVGARIYTRLPVPSGTAYPYLDIQDATSVAHNLVNQVVYGTRETVQVQVWSDGTVPVATLEQVMDRVRAVLHRSNGSVTGATIWSCVFNRNIPRPAVTVNGNSYLPLLSEYVLEVQAA